MEIKLTSIARRAGLLAGWLLLGVASEPALPHDISGGIPDCLVDQSCLPPVDHFQSSWSVTDTSYQLSKIDVWYPSSLFGFYGLQLTFTNSSGQTQTSSMIGTTTGDKAHVTHQALQIDMNKQLKYMDQYGYDPDYWGTGLRFIYSDNTFVDVGQLDLTVPALRTTLTSQLVGLDCLFYTVNTKTSKLFGCNAMVHQYSFKNTFQNVVCTLSQAATTKSWKTDAPATAGETFTAVLTLNGAAISFPAWMTINYTARSVTIDTMFTSGISKADLGVYSLTVTGTVSNNINPATGQPWTISFTSTITILSDCTLATTISASPALTNMSTDLGYPQSQTFVYTDNISASHNDPTYCPKTYALNQNLPYLTLSGTTLKLSSTNTADLGNHQFNLQVSLVDKPTLSINDHFSAILTDPCKDIVFQGTTPALSGDVTINMPLTGLMTVSFVPIQFNTVHNVNMNCPYTVTLVTAPAFFKIAASQSAYKVDPSLIILPTDIGTSHGCQIDLHSPQSGVQTLSINFNTKVVCDITDFSLAAPVADQIYYILEGSVTLGAFTLQQTAACNYPVSYSSTTATLNGVSTAPPAGLSFSAANKNWTMSSTDLSLWEESYQIKKTATIPVINPATGMNWAVEVGFNLKFLRLGCKTTSLINKTFNNMTYAVATNALTQNAQFDDTFSNSSYANVSIKCGPFSLSFSPTYAFVTFDGTNVVVQTNDDTLVGTYDVTMTVGLTFYPMVQPLVKPFKVIIQCSSTLAFTNPPTLIQHRPLIDIEPLVTFFPVSQTCGQTPTYTFSWVSPIYTGNGSVSVNPLSTGVELQVSGMDKNVDSRSYTVSITATTTSSSTSVTFVLEVINGCSETVFLTTPVPLPDIQFAYGSPPLTQATAFITQFKVNTGVGCATVLSLSPTANFISLQGTDIVVDGTSMVQSDFGVHNFTLTATSKIFSTTVPSADYVFVVTLSCQITNVSSSPSMLSTTHKLFQGASYVATTIASPTFTISPALCATSLSYQVLDQGAPVTYILVTGTTITIDTQDPTLSVSKTYLIVATAASTTYITGATGNLQLTVVFQGCESTTMLAPSLPFANLTYVAGHEPAFYSLPPFRDSLATLTAVPGLCGPRKIIVTPANTFLTFTAPPNEFTDPQYISLFTSQLTQVGTYKFTVDASFVNYPTLLAASVSFDVVIINPCTITKLQPSQIADMTVKVGDPAVIQTFTQSTDTEAILLNQPNLCGERSYSIIGAKLPITIIQPLDPWKEPLKLILQAFTASMVGEYSITLQVTLVSFPAISPATSTFKAIIQKPNSPPRFKDPLPATITITKTWEPQSWSFTLPSVIDEDASDVLKTTPIFGAASAFLKFVNNSKLVVDDTSVSQIPAAFYIIKFTLDDSKSQTTYSTMLFVYDAPPKPQPQQEQAPPQPECEVEISKPQVPPQVTYVSGTSPMMVSWDSFQLKGSKECTEGKSIQVELKTAWQDNRFVKESDWLQYTSTSIGSERAQSYFTISSDQIFDRELNASVTVIATAKGKSASFDLTITIKPATSPQTRRWVKAKPPSLIIQKVSESGLVTLEFDSPIIVFNRPSDPFMANPGKYLEFTVVKNPLSSYYDDPEYIKSGNVLQLSISSFTTRQIEVQIELSNPIYVSIDAFHRDQLKVRIVDESTFVSAIDFITTANRYGTAQIEIARFLSNEIKSVVENLQKQQTTINAFVTGSLPINIVLGLSLKYLWGMVNSLQFVIFMDQWKVNWPPNASMAIKTVRTVALAEFIDTKKVEQKVFDFYGLNQTHKESPGRRLEVTQASQGTRFDRISVSVIIVLFIISVLIVGVVFTIKSRFKDKLIKALKDLKNSIFWNGLIRFYLQSFLKQTITIGITFATIQLGQSSVKRTKWSKIVLVSIESLALFIVVPILFVYVLKKHRHQLRLSSIKQKFGSLYLGIRTDSFYRIFYVLEFLATRFMFVAITFALARYPGILVNMYMLLNNANIIYLGWFKPFDTNSQNNIELINSWMLHLIAYALLLLANLMPNPQNEINVGWAVIGCIGVIFLINLGFMMSISVQKIIRQLYFWKLKREILRKKREREEAKQAVTIELVARPIISELASPLPADYQASDDHQLTVIPLNQGRAIPLQQDIRELQHKVQQSLLRISSLNESVNHESDSIFVSSHDSIIMPSSESEQLESNAIGNEDLPPNSSLIALIEARRDSLEEAKVTTTPSIEDSSLTHLTGERIREQEPNKTPWQQPPINIMTRRPYQNMHQQAIDRLNQRLKERQPIKIEPIPSVKIEFAGIDEALRRIEDFAQAKRSQSPSMTSRL